MTRSTTSAVVVDTSAAVALLLREERADEMLARLVVASCRLMSAATRVELGLVLEARLGPPGRDVVDRFLRDAQIEVVAVDAEAAERALGAWRRFGRGRHPAGLDYGDCFAYALTEQTAAPLLCTGDDFAATDLDLACPPATGR